MKDTIDPFLSTYSGVRWSAPDDETIEGEFALAPLSLRYTKAQRRLHLRLTEISAIETWNSASNSAEHRLVGRGELAEVLTVFELDGGPVRQFQEVRGVRIAPAPVAACTDNTRHSQVYPDHLENTWPAGAFFIDFEALRIHGEHPESALHLHLTMELGEFNRVYALVHQRADDLKEVSLALKADLFGDGINLDVAWGGWMAEYGMLRPADAPLVFAQARLERMDVLLERTRVLGNGHVTPTSLLHASPPRLDQLNEDVTLLARRLGWIVAILAVIALIMLFGKGETDKLHLLPRQIAENTQHSTPELGKDHVVASKSSV